MEPLGRVCVLPRRKSLKPLEQQSLLGVILPGIHALSFSFCSLFSNTVIGQVIGRVGEKRTVANVNIVAGFLKRGSRARLLSVKHWCVLLYLSPS